MSTIDKIPAFPTENERQTGSNSYQYEGMTLRQYAAIRLKVPDSGDEDLDVLIKDPDPDVRGEVARQGYGLDVLINDTNWYVRGEATRVFADTITHSREIAKPEKSK